MKHVLMCISSALIGAVIAGTFWLMIIGISSIRTNKRIIVFMENGSGINMSQTHISVDSVTQTTTKSATIWINGRKTTIYADRIMIAN
jgi:hypothetical protein